MYIKLCLQFQDNLCQKNVRETLTASLLQLLLLLFVVVVVVGIIITINVAIIFIVDIKLKSYKQYNSKQQSRRKTQCWDSMMK